MGKAPAVNGRMEGGINVPPSNYFLQGLIAADSEYLARALAAEPRGEGGQGLHRVMGPEARAAPE